MKTALTIAGTDPSGGAGIQVDLQVFRDLGFHGLSAITAVVWQNTQGVGGYEAMSPAVLGAQLAAVAEDLPVSAVKIGMVPRGAHWEEIRAFLSVLDGRVLDGQAAEKVPVVLDPVLAEGSGARALADEESLTAMEVLMERVDLITPNGDEARRLLGPGVRNTGSAGQVLTGEELALLLNEKGWRRVLVKGGHLPREEGAVVDWYCEEGECLRLGAVAALPEDIRGTGCQLASAVAAFRARGQPWLEAVEDARTYLQEMLRQAESVGKGRPVVVR